MHKLTTLVSAIGVLTAQAAVAADDFGRDPHRRALTRSAGIGAMADLTLKFGSRRTVRESDTLTIGIAAGPVRGVWGRNGAPMDRVSSLVSLKLRPGYSAALGVAGQPVLTHRTQLGAAQSRADGGKKGPSTLGWVAIGAGAILVTGLVLAAVCLDNINDNYETESSDSCLG